MAALIPSVLAQVDEEISRILSPKRSKGFVACGMIRDANELLIRLRRCTPFSRKPSRAIPPAITFLA